MLLQLRRDHESVTETGEIRNDATAVGRRDCAASRETMRIFHKLAKFLH